MYIYFCLLFKYTIYVLNEERKLDQFSLLTYCNSHGKFQKIHRYNFNKKNIN